MYKGTKIPSQDGEQSGRDLGSAEEWAEGHRRLTPKPWGVPRWIPGPGWLDDNTPCVCSRSRVLVAGSSLSSQLFEWLMSEGSGGVVCTYDPMDKGTKEQ